MTGRSPTMKTNESAGARAASCRERPTRPMSSRGPAPASWSPSRRISARERSTPPSTSSLRAGSRADSGCTAPGQLAYQSIALPSSCSCGSAKRSAAPSPRRRRTTRRSCGAELCSGSPRTPKGGTPLRVVTISVFPPAISVAKIARGLWRRDGAVRCANPASNRLRPFAQDEFLHFARRRHGQVAEHHVAWALEGGEVGAAVGDDLLGRDGGAGLQHHEGAGRLAPFLVGLGDDGGVGDRRMLDDHALDLDGRDVLAARDDDVLGTVAQLDVAVLVQHAQV